LGLSLLGRPKQSYSIMILSCISFRFVS
jgi:hypothetical protein